MKGTKRTLVIALVVGVILTLAIAGTAMAAGNGQQLQTRTTDQACTTCTACDQSQQHLRAQDGTCDGTCLGAGHGTCDGTCDGDADQLRLRDGSGTGEQYGQRHGAGN